MASGNAPTTGQPNAQPAETGNTGGANNPPNPPVSASARRVQAPKSEKSWWGWLVSVILIVAAAGVIAGKINYIEALANDAVGRANDAVGIATTVSDRVDGLEKSVNKAQGSADRANARQSAMVNIQNEQLKVMMADIRKGNQDFELCSKSDAEINSLLTNGVWDVEPKIMAEDARLKGLQALATAEAVKANSIRLEAVTVVATQAFDAGETAISAVGQIAEQPNRFLGKSVKTGTKKTIKQQLAEYRQKYGK